MDASLILSSKFLGVDEICSSATAAARWPVTGLFLPMGLEHFWAHCKAGLYTATNYFAETAAIAVKFAHQCHDDVCGVCAAANGNMLSRALSERPTPSAGASALPRRASAGPFEGLFPAS